VETVPCDLQDFESVKAAVAMIKGKYDAIDVLCNNAGVMAIEDKATKDGYDVQMQTNHLSHFLITKELFPLIQRASELRGEARIVNHSSMARHGAPLDAKYLGKNGGNLGGNGNSMFFNGGKWQRYHQTKLANAVFTKTLAARLAANPATAGIKATVAAPGYAATNLQATSNETGGMSGAMWTRRFAQSAENGTMPLLMVSFSEGVGNEEFWEPKGAIKGIAVNVDWDKVSTSEEAAKILWEKSEEAVGEFKI